MRVDDELAHLDIVEVALGLDPSPERLGFAFLDILTGQPMWNGAVEIYRIDAGWREHQVMEAMRLLRFSLDRKLDARYLVTLIGVERMFVGRNANVSIDLAEVSGYVSQAASYEWPTAIVEHLTPPEWRRLNGLKGNAPKADVLANAEVLGFEIDQTNPFKQDAADACHIVRGAWRLATDPEVKDVDRPSALYVHGQSRILAPPSLRLRSAA